MVETLVSLLSLVTCYVLVGTLKFFQLRDSIINYFVSIWKSVKILDVSHLALAC